MHSIHSIYQCHIHIQYKVELWGASVAHLAEHIPHTRVAWAPLLYVIPIYPVFYLHWL